MRSNRIIVTCRRLKQIAGAVSCVALIGVAIAGLLSNYYVGSQGSPDEHEYTFEFGRVLAGSKVLHNFEVKNRTSRAITVLESKTTCSCSIAKHLPHEITPGTAATICVELNTTNKSGYVEEVVYVSLSDGSRKVFRLHGYVEPVPITELDFGDLMRGDVASKRHFQIHTRIEPEFAISGIKFDRNFFDVAERGHSDNVRAYEVSVLKDIPYGSFSKAIDIATTDKLLPNKYVRVRGRVLHPVVVEPNLLMLGECAPGIAKSESIRVFSPYGKEFTIRDVDYHGHPLKCEFDQIPATDHVVTIEVSIGQEEKKIIKSTIDISTDLDGAPQALKVEVYGLRASIES